MAKTIKLKCTSTITESFIENRLYSARVDDEGNISIGKGKGKIFLAVGVCGEIACVSKGCIAARFVELKTKTIKCTWVNHSMQIKKTLKAGKRYQIEQGRVLGGVAGYVFDEDGDRLTLYREEVGFSAAGGAYLFEAKYS